MTTLKDRLWIWGHEAGSHNGMYDIEGSVMTPAEGAEYLGARNMFMIVHLDKPKPPFDDYSRDLCSLLQVKWSVVGDGSSEDDNTGIGNLEEVLRQAQIFPNITGGMFDDFFLPHRMAEYTPERLKSMADRLHKNEGRPLDMWCVLYNHDLDKDIGSFLDAFDGVSFWTWKESDLISFEDNYHKFLSMTKGKKRMLGCYLYNYGEQKQSTVEMMEYQLKTYAECIKRREVEGIIFCSNTVMDLGFCAVAAAKNWIAEHGDMEID